MSSNKHGVAVQNRVMQWRDLGTTIDQPVSADEALRLGHLAGWNVRKAPLVAFSEDGQRLAVPDQFAVIRDNPFHRGQYDVLGNVGKVFHPIQNEEHTGLLDALVDESGSNIVAAGALHNGRKVFVTMQIPGHIKVGGVDPHSHYITAINGHDGNTKFTVAVTLQREACTNVLNMGFMGKPASYGVRHTKNSTKALVGEARRILDLSFDYLEGFQEEAERLINQTMTQAQFEEIVEREFGAPEDAGAAARTRAETKFEQMVELFTESLTHAGVRETAWAGLNAMTEWFDHYSPVRGDDRHTTRTTKAVLDPSFKNKALEIVRQA